MPEQSVIVWDLETVPDLAAAARMLDLGDATEVAVREALGSGFPKHPLHKIVCIGALVASRQPEGWRVDALGAPHAGERAEGELISAFVEKVGQLRPQLITFNGHSFDLPVLRYRAMVNRVPAGGLQVRSYFNRYTDDALDLCDVLGSYVPGAKVKLDEVSKILGLTGKPEGVDGGQVEAMVLAGQIEEVARYCESDVLNTYRVWLIYALFRGSITVQELDWSERQIRDFVATRKSANPHLCAAVGIVKETDANQVLPLYLNAPQIYDRVIGALQRSTSVSVALPSLSSRPRGVASKTLSALTHLATRSAPTRYWLSSFEARVGCARSEWCRCLSALTATGYPRRMTPMFRRAYYSASDAEFLRASPAAVLGELVAHQAFPVDQNQRNAWQVEISHLQEVANDLSDSFFFLEFAIPRMGKRADAVIIAGGVVFVLEYKVGANDYQKHAIDQVLDYALDLKNFHEGSHSRTLVPILVATKAPAQELEVNVWSDGVMRPILTNRETLLPTIRELLVNLKSIPIDAEAWAASSYKPTPTIVEAAQALYRGHDVQEISRSEAGAENLSRTGAYIARVIEEAKRWDRRAICFVTGVPGSGKTLAGLNIATERMRSSADEHAVFLSGNGPLVAVLREALANDEVDRSKASSAKTVSKSDANRHASAFIQNIHHFRDEYVRTAEAPRERVVVFDEAQRAWNREQATRFMREKRGQAEFDKSEPQFLLSVMDRHKDWCVVVCLIGGGQEINTGEAGLEEWLTAIERNHPDWQIHRSDYLGGSHVPASLERLDAVLSPALHLAISVRSFRAEVLSDFVGAVVGGEAKLALSLHRELTTLVICS
jgi:predicted PolB exonuclease-like 3'-5' exonuclease